MSHGNVWEIWVIIIQYSSHAIKLLKIRMPDTKQTELSNFQQHDIELMLLQKKKKTWYQTSEFLVERRFSFSFNLTQFLLNFCSPSLLHTM